MPQLMVRQKVFLVLLVAGVALAATIAVRWGRNNPNNQPPQPDAMAPSAAPDLPATPAVSETLVAPRQTAPASTERAIAPAPAEAHSVTTNKLERLAEIRESFRALAAGNRTNALHAAKQITDGTERETALLTLVTEWTHGELGAPQQRAHNIDTYGLEAGLGMELAKNPELAMLWANEMTDGPGRAAVLQEAAKAMVGGDPTAAFALGEQLPADDRQKFLAGLYAGWAGEDTDAALQWANQLTDPAERDSALQAIRSAAPVGIGAALRIQDGYPVINQLVPDSPAELSGQLHPGDRILGLAQGDNSFVDAHGLTLQDIVAQVRGAPNTTLQLQVLPADAPPNSTPQIVTIVRDQIKFKPPK